MPAVKKEQWKPDILVKGRNEPAAIVQVLEVMAGARKEDLYDLANSIYDLLQARLATGSVISVVSNPELTLIRLNLF